MIQDRIRRVRYEFLEGENASEYEVERHTQVRDECRLVRTHVLVWAEEKIWKGWRYLNSIENCGGMLAQPWEVIRVIDEHLVHVSTFFISATAV
jgi:hypothetical protein